jgi:hypothetical protein
MNKIRIHHEDHYNIKHLKRESIGLCYNHSDSIASVGFYSYDIIDEALFSVFLLKYSDKLKYSKIIEDD